jgi:hypothetical protein
MAESNPQVFAGAIMSPIASFGIALVAWFALKQDCTYDNGIGSVQGECVGSFHDPAVFITTVTGALTLLGFLILFIVWMNSLGSSE